MAERRRVVANPTVASRVTSPSAIQNPLPKTLQTPSRIPADSHPMDKNQGNKNRGGSSREDSRQVVARRVANQAARRRVAVSNPEEAVRDQLVSLEPAEECIRGEAAHPVILQMVRPGQESQVPGAGSRRPVRGLTTIPMQWIRQVLPGPQSQQMTQHGITKQKSTKQHRPPDWL